MKDEERKELEQEYENLKLLASFHEAYGVPENEKEREALINDILDRMNEIREKLKRVINLPPLRGGIKTLKYDRYKRLFANARNEGRF